jgi:hypothetical protein
MDAGFCDRGKPMQPARQPFRNVDQIDELRRILGEQKRPR